MNELITGLIGGLISGFGIFVYTIIQDRNKHTLDLIRDEKLSALNRELEELKIKQSIQFSRLFSEQADSIKVLYSSMNKMNQSLFKWTMSMGAVTSTDKTPIPQEVSEKIDVFKNDYIKSLNAFTDAFSNSEIFLPQEVCDELRKILEESMLVYQGVHIHEQNQIPLLTNKEIIGKMIQKIPEIQKTLLQMYRKIIGTIPSQNTEPKNV